MKRVLGLATSVWLAFFVAGCGSSEPSTISDDSHEDASGGSRANPETAGPAGGSRAEGNQDGSETGSAGGNKADGNEGGTKTGPAAGNEASGNQGGTETGPAAGNDAGANPVGGGGATGAEGGDTGAKAGDKGGQGGVSNPPKDEPELITSGEDAYWKEGTLTEVGNGNADVTVNDSPAQN